MSDRTRFALTEGMDLSGASLEEVWWRYAAIGGLAGPEVLAQRIAGETGCTDSEHNLIAQALNECFHDRGLITSPVGYASPSDGQPPLDVLMAALGTRRVDPSRSPSAVAEARQRAREARMRSATAARQAATLQITAARLMQASGQHTYAQHARRRAELARTRGAAELRKP